MQTWITDRPPQRRKKRHDDQPRLQLPLPRPTVLSEQKRDTKGEHETVERGVAEVDFYI